MINRNDDEGLPAEVPNTPEHEEALWKMHMEAAKQPELKPPCSHRLTPNAKAVLDILMREVETDDVRYVSKALREAADWLDHWIEDGPGGMLAS